MVLDHYRGRKILNVLYNPNSELTPIREQISRYKWKINYISKYDPYAYSHTPHIPESESSHKY